MAEEVEEQKKKGSGKLIIIVLIVLIVVLLAVVGVGGYLLYSGALNSDDANASNNQEEQVKETNDDETFQVAINDLVLNITNAKGREKLMKLSFTLKSIEPSIEGLIETNKAEIVDTVIQKISARSSEELLTVGGKELLKEELLDDINAILNRNEDIEKNNIKQLFFTTFVIK